ncbi:MAG: MerC domain-containing protein [Saprospiraceae bacterium]|nr:MerC domain-containing protein [Saprospiraceae bacterium]
MLALRPLPQSDILGAVASGLCVIHCVATPLLFVIHTCSVTGCKEGSPAWWSSLDYLFVGITFLAVRQSAINTSKGWMNYALYVNWILLTLLIVNEKLAVLPIAEMWKYLTAFSLIGLHMYNRRYCRCDNPICAPQ